MADADSSCNDLKQLSEEDIYELANFPPAISDEVAEALEKSSCTKERGQQRRLCLVACSRSSDDLAKLSIDEPEAFGEMLECIEAFKEHTKGLAELSESAYFRMRIADCRTAESAA
jgi:hypothetical protein